MSDREEGEGFLARWSRRKRDAAAVWPAPQPDPAPLPNLSDPAPPEPPLRAEPAAAEPPRSPAFDPASLPPVESLTLESDITAFLRQEVPAVLRQAALRRIWSLDPAIRDFVGPADYAWDYNAPDGVPGFAPTLTGDVKRLLAQAIGLEEEEAEAPAEAPAAVPDTPGMQASVKPPRSERPSPCETDPPPSPSAEPPASRSEQAVPPATLAEGTGPAAQLPSGPAPPRRHGRALPS